MAYSSAIRPAAAAVAPLMRTSYARTTPSTTALRRTVLGTASAQCPRFYAAVPSRGRMLREIDKMARQSSKKTDTETMSKIQRKANDEYFKTGGGPLFPGTFVSLPVSSYPRAPAAFAKYAWYRLFQWGVEYLSLLNVKLKSMPNWTTRPKWKIATGRIAPTAKVMYADMLAAFAAGDKATINNLCLGAFAQKLSAAIDRRKAGEVLAFEVLRYNSPLFYPRVVAHQVHQVNPHDKEMATQQAVVAISSRQRAARHNASTGALIPGSTKIQDKIEYVVLSRQVSEVTFQAGPWRIWGTVPATTLESYQQEQAWIKREQAERAGYVPRTPNKDE